MLTPLIYALCFFSIALLSPLKADYIPLEKLLKKAMNENLFLPKAEKDGRVQSLNKRGAALPVSNRIVNEFIEYARTGEKQVIQLDCKFGHIPLLALQHNINHYTAADANHDHLAIIARRAKKLLPQDKRQNLKLFLGNFPESFKHFQDNTFDAILFNRVLHFYSPNQVVRALKETFRTLKPGGKIFIVAITPYVKRFQSFIPQYKQRLLLKHQYPGHVRNLKYFANPSVTTPKELEQMHDKSFIFFDAEFMHSLLSEAGFIVKKSIEFPLGFQSDTWELDGRELVGAIAKKPLQKSSFPLPKF